VKDERVKNVYLKFHVIVIIFECYIELAIEGGEENKNFFLENH